MVEAGWALAYRKCAADYIDAEDGARAGGAGLWAGTFVAPWDYRAGAGRASEPAASGGCVIKGNISSSGERIYHAPGGQYDERTKIDEAKGERRFCTEEEAVAAGWRKSKRQGKKLMRPPVKVAAAWGLDGTVTLLGRQLPRRSNDGVWQSVFMPCSG